MEQKQKTNFKELDDWSEWHTSKKSMISFSFGSFGIELVGNAFGALYFWFYENELGLFPWLILIANIVFAVWNAVNDPIIGYVIEKPRKFWGKWGKRFPWIATTLIPMYLCYFLLFAPPVGAGPFVWFLWMMTWLVLADTFYSMFHISWVAMFAEKYRTDEERRKGNAYKLVLAIISIIIGAVLPPEIYEYGNVQSFALMAAIVFFFGSIAGIAVIYGAREDPARKAQAVAQGEQERTPFIQLLKTGLKNKAFLAYVLLYFGNKTWDYFVVGGVDYYNAFILGEPADSKTILLAAVILGIFVAVPIFTKLAKKYGFYKTAVIGGLTEAILTLPLLFIQDLIVAIPFAFIIGIGNGAMWAMLSPVLSEALDSLSVQLGKRATNVYAGVYIFFGRLSIILFTIFMLGIHELTGYVPVNELEAFLGDGNAYGKTLQTDLAKFGILLTFVIIPTIITALSTIGYAKIYDIKGDKKIWLENQLKEQDIGH
ncbi:MAG: putative Na+/melibiose symporter-like transporter [Promethearchaeota archaeon]|nr:MAG: putative Na+/melibiose symporter-like transporter [Candidatus Lokiarchaeota archaeon]